MTVDTAYKIILFAINKSQNGYVSPDEFNLIINQAQTQFMNYLLGEFQQYQVGRPISRVQYGNNETTRQRLTPFIKSASLTVGGDGTVLYPSNYQQTDTMWTTNDSRVKFVSQDYLSSYLSSKIDPVATNPIYLLNMYGFKFYPSTIGSAKINYIETPNQIVWGYTTDSNGLPVYAPSSSVDPRWYDVDMMEIITRALRIIGVNLQSGMVSQYANEIEQKGQ
ncbi:MAG: hypothetical protein K8R85_01505 [Bacteroidetes bacterium]|nr:hypothetical protein [Bacteroidota bacterium]